MTCELSPLPKPPELTGELLPSGYVRLKPWSADARQFILNHADRLGLVQYFDSFDMYDIIPFPGYTGQQIADFFNQYNK